MGNGDNSATTESLARQTFKKDAVHPGQLVLKFNGRNETKPGKFRVKWLGPFKIHEVGANGAIKLWTMDGMEVSDAVNGSKLKIYHQRRQETRSA